LNVREEKLQKECRKLQVIKRENYKNLLLLLLEKCASGSLIITRSICPVEDASARSSSITACEFLSHLFLKVFWK